MASPRSFPVLERSSTDLAGALQTTFSSPKSCGCARPPTPPRLDPLLKSLPSHFINRDFLSELGGAMRLKEKQGDVETRKGENETQEDMMRNEKKRREAE